MTYIIKNKFKTLLGESANQNKLILLDVDDTILKPSQIYIYRTLPTDNTEVKLTPAEYAEEDVTDETKKYYDYRDFLDPQKIKRSISTAEPIVANLQIMDDLLRRGYKVGILTARSSEDFVYRGLKDWLMFRNKKGDLIPIGDSLERENVFAVNDTKRVQGLKGTTDYEKKAEVVKSLLDVYDEILFIDDDTKNIKEMRRLKNSLPKELNNKLFVKHALY
mgnify:CR=1 FL=1|jgi:hypothetical protein|tara:strand:- start:1149 stop:1808 length:660 start_codon:yes stop_codon:yes gene_type:complete